ncbi:P-loop containing nucleoside triphosphate hydrolase protein [Lanmaoa asiatica]|nr:P-loop containing nucleoside triphosphate hydrolase protein [Lanmaoa asiatica]
MDDYDAYLYSIDDIELVEEGESDNDVLDNIDEEQAHTDTAVVLVPASSPTRERESGDEQQPEPSSTVLKSMAKCDRVLTEKFGFSGYKAKQKEIIQAAISGADVFVLAPTGMGKSLCFQVPAIAEDVSHSTAYIPFPVLSSTNIPAEVTNLRSKGISAVSLTSESTKGEKTEILRDLSSKQPKNRLFYTTPEKLCTQDLMRTLATVYDNGQLSRLVIDEEWGHDFREEYRKLGSFRERFPGVPVMALTATATKNVQRDIIRSLKMVEDKLFTAVHPFNRTNLFYEVRYKSAPECLSLMQDILEFIEALHRRRNRPSSGIIYCRKREMCDELSNYLRGKGLNARPYHRGISSKTLSKTLKEWEVGGTGEGGVDVVCATIAFGMGIDKSDVRYAPLVVYYTTVRYNACRTSVSSLGLAREDALRLRKLVSSAHARRQDATSSKNGPEPSQRSIDSLGALVSLVENVTTCRHVSMCRYFGEIIDTADDDVMESVCDKMCDVCKFPEKTRQRKTNLSDDNYAAAVISMSAWNAGYEDDEDSEGRNLQQQQPQPQQRQHVPMSAGTSVNALNPGQMTLWDCLNSAPIQGFKRPNGHGRDKQVLPNSKRTKIERAKDERTTSGTGSTSSASTSARGSMPPPLVTRPHSSVNTLRKPFKTPFKTPLKVPGESHHLVAKVNDPGRDRDREPEQGVLSPPIGNQHAQKDEESKDTVEIVEVQIKQEPTPPDDATDDQADADMVIPEVEMEVEASFSRKVPLEIRTSTFDSLRKCLHRVFPLDTASTGGTAWSILGGAPTTMEGRTLVLADAAKKLEHGIQMMSSTTPGYETRVMQKRRAIASLERMARDKNSGKNGAPSDEDEDVEEVMDALRGGVEWWWHKIQKGHVRS